MNWLAVATVVAILISFVVTIKLLTPRADKVDPSQTIAVSIVVISAGVVVLATIAAICYKVFLWAWS